MLPLLDAKPYIVKPGDNLSSIAKNYGYRDWKVIYLSKCNQRLRQIRSDPNLIKPGDPILLPPKVADIRATLDRRLQKLLDLRRETETLFTGVAKELDSEFARLQNTAKNVDTAAEIILIFKTLGAMCWKGHKAIELGGEELVKANKELGKEALDMAYDKPQNMILETFAEKLENPRTVQVMDSSVWVFSAVVVKSWLDINSPSYWAGVISELKQGSSFSTAVTRRPEEIHRTARQGLEKTKADSLRNLDTKIAETRRLQGLFGGAVGTPLPLK